MNFLGVRERRGGNTVAEGFDCSGFTRHVFEHSIGLVLPRRSQEQAQASGLKTVDRHELRPGDLVFFNTLRAAFSHVGIYIGDGKFIHSSRKKGVTISSLDAPYYKKTFVGAKRLADMERSLDDVLGETAGMLDVPLTERNHPPASAGVTRNGTVDSLLAVTSSRNPVNGGQAQECRPAIL